MKLFRINVGENEFEPGIEYLFSHERATKFDFDFCVEKLLRERILEDFKMHDAVNYVQDIDHFFHLIIEDLVEEGYRLITKSVFESNIETYISTKDCINKEEVIKKTYGNFVASDIVDNLIIRNKKYDEEVEGAKQKALKHIKINERVMKQ